MLKGAAGGCAVLVWLCAWPGAGRAQAPAGTPEVARVLASLAERAQKDYDRVSTIICQETVTQQEVRPDRTANGKPRVTLYELNVSRDARDWDLFKVERTLQSVDGKPARKGEEPGCTDPKTGTPEPLAFLLSRNQRRYRFTFAQQSAGGPPRSIAIDFAETPPERVNITWHRNCFSVEGGGEEGRLWFDPDTFDVLQISTKLPRPVSVPIPGTFGSNPPVRVETSEVTMKFKRIDFHDPEESILLPESTDTLTIFLGVPSLHTLQILSDFRRFLTRSTVRPVQPM